MKSDEMVYSMQTWRACVYIFTGSVVVRDVLASEREAGGDTFIFCEKEAW